ncbi:lipopolysaccharide transport system ATP-binding protein [Bathymodiolus platifrons methanotrophic gill symbiont]|uniref:ABC transporter ATP-binding protein n=1 Tax=Bathymodiolus platifrons methanotrophic gill symbiont TaxID=113268 RepID=UPI0011C9E20B|nr:ABC transporter ATP-binding protein [Bathymodiolus platifrons methanotrophic gill symbiont]TXK96350.1 ABC transporter ATP-binding protein [Methylococcaceae bacterium HT1]TXL17425.1 ABC transporter ATP-binding protein [Methylococcaceae bacterium HT3]TXL23367.1 ABC transporter ATP-binding protein [Methylococcaceae bacterium HT2]GFO75458.1 lipopolysaccharide transport system ATP-binding protein [Bathymodiolus platifrons methanotrophic gill symbiont]
MSALIATDLSKAYRRYQKPIDSLKELVFRQQYHEQFWALKGASFRCEPGEILGVVGDNGAGKSSLLKLLAGTMQPTQGELIVNGRVSAILELGSGFHPDFTGLENIHLGCAMLGLNAGQIAAKVDEIIDFSELADFIKQPVKTYSSGMFVRLAFSVVTSVDPDILVVDEALSVGDQHFQKKSMDRMMTFKDQGKALVFCSHSLYHVKELCERAIWLDKGVIQAQGESGEVIDQYNDHVRMQNSVSVSKPGQTESIENADKSQLTAYLVEATLLNGSMQDGDDLPIYQTGDCFRVKVMAHKQASLALDDVHIGIIIKRNDGVQCFGVSTILDGVSIFTTDDENELGIVYEVPDLSLLSGLYSLEVWLIDATSAHVYDSMRSCCEFKVRQSGTEVGITYLEHQWSAPI